MERNLERWLDEAPRLECDWDALKATYRRSLVDLAALRFSPPIAGGRSLPAAGLPWFMTMFGRDSIFTSLQALPFTPELAATTLRALGDWQGTPRRRLPRRGSGPDPARDALRGDDGVRGAAALALLRLRRRHAAVRRPARRVRALDRRHAGSCASSSTRRARRSTGSTSTPTSWATATSRTSVATRRPASRTSAGRTPGTRSPTATARLPGFPRATCELQGYAYDAKVRGARLARLVWKDPALADKLEKEAADLKRRFNRDFWVDDGEYFALALDADGNQVDALASNNGHLLWSGIVDKSKAKAVARHLIGPRLFSGWGVRTLAEGEGRYNPIGYHVGTVWPFDNSFIAWGLRRYGFKDEAAADRRRHPRRGRVLRRAPAGGVRRLRADGDEVPGAVPDRVQPAGVVDRHAAAAPADDARPRAARRPPRRRPGAPGRHRSSRAARHPRALGPDRRLRTRPRGRHGTQPEVPCVESSSPDPEPKGGQVSIAEPQTARATRRADLLPADVLVVFGITGDLAKVMTFRSLYRLEQRGLLDCPIVGVAVDDWTVDDLVARAREAIEGTGEKLDESVFDRFASRLSYVSGRLRRSVDLRARRRGDRAAPRLPSSTSRSRRSCSARWSKGSPTQA